MTKNIIALALEHSASSFRERIVPGSSGVESHSPPHWAGSTFRPPPRTALKESKSAYPTPRGPRRRDTGRLPTATGKPDAHLQLLGHRLTLVLNGRSITAPLQRLDHAQDRAA